MPGRISTLAIAAYSRDIVPLHRGVDVHIDSSVEDS